MFSFLSTPFFIFFIFILKSISATFFLYKFSLSLENLKNPLYCIYHEKYYNKEYYIFCCYSHFMISKSKSYNLKHFVLFIGKSFELFND